MNEVPVPEYHTQWPPAVSFSRVGRCRRQRAYQVLKVPVTNPIPPDVLKRMQAGSEAEPEVVELLQSEGYKITGALGLQQMVALKVGEVLFRGKLDGFILDPRERQEVKGWTTLEMKRINPRALNNWKRTGVRGFRPYYLDTTMGYMAATGVWVGRFVASDPKLNVFHEIVEFDIELWKQLVDRWSEVWEGVLKGVLPEPDYWADPWHCKPESCQWSTRCPSGRQYQKSTGEKSLPDFEELEDN